MLKLVMSINIGKGNTPTILRILPLSFFSILRCQEVEMWRKKLRGANLYVRPCPIKV